MISRKATNTLKTRITALYRRSGLASYQFVFLGMEHTRETMRINRIEIKIKHFVTKKCIITIDI